MRIWLAKETPGSSPFWGEKAPSNSGDSVLFSVEAASAEAFKYCSSPVSYTHLTLPTIRLV